MSIPAFTISKENLHSITEQIQESERFSIEIENNEWYLEAYGTARCQNFYEKETNSNWSDIDKIEITLKVYDENGDSFDFSDEFEKAIFDQINVISK